MTWVFPPPLPSAAASPIVVAPLPLTQRPA
jgi:hypothetical protein